MQFKKFLLKNFGKKLLLEYGEDEEVITRFFSGGKRQPPNYNKYKNIDVVHGHFRANRFDSFENIDLVTFLREPAQRLVSNYYFFKRNFYSHSPICHMIRDGLTLSEYIDLDANKNTQSFFLANKNIDDFKFVGILEDYENSLKIMKKIFGLRPSLDGYFEYYKKLFISEVIKRSDLMNFEKLSSNKNIERSNLKYDLEPVLLEKIKKNNELDYDLYKSALTKYNGIKLAYDL